MLACFMHHGVTLGCGSDDLGASLSLGASSGLKGPLVDSRDHWWTQGTIGGLKGPLVDSRDHWWTQGTIGGLKGPLVYTPQNSHFRSENGWLGDDPFLLGWPIIRAELLVSGRVGMS